ncbi:hypothetical protein EUGRSUZ_H04532 [Eucalyptus grandis]|uniref:Rapid alkalinization factor 1 n=3 Tax=Eucalyptus TaxID=3932 RepID=A0A059B6K1_EUCGR|nr:hypothetical protein EUGRSUZ_H04532 [Eucalyptus grandis]
MASIFSPSPRSCLFLISALVLASLLASAVHGGGVSEHGHRLGWAGGAGGSRCEGSIAECLAAGGDGEGEFDLDSESNRRILATSSYISYGALKRNTVPCSRRGASYYNCRPGASSNPYSRGCSAITRCRG